MPSRHAADVILPPCDVIVLPCPSWSDVTPSASGVASLQTWRAPGEPYVAFIHTSHVRLVAHLYKTWRPCFSGVPVRESQLLLQTYSHQSTQLNACAKRSVMQSLPVLRFAGLVHTGCVSVALMGVALRRSKYARLFSAAKQRVKGFLHW